MYVRPCFARHPLISTLYALQSLLMNEGWDGMGPASNYLLVLSGQGASLLDRNKYERIVGRLLRAFPDRKVRHTMHLAVCDQHGLDVMLHDGVRMHAVVLH